MIAEDRSYDCKIKVGSVIVTEDNTQVLALGYNGNYKGGPNERDSLEHGKSGFVHAEMNALVKCDFTHPKKKIMYLTHSPCLICSKLIVNADISRVVFDEIYESDVSGVLILLEILGQDNVLFHDKVHDCLTSPLPYLNPCR